MPDWTPAELHDALDRRDRARLRLLMLDLTHSAEIGRQVVYRRLGPAVVARTIEDDIQDVLLYLIKDNARILRKYGGRGEYHLHAGGLRRFVTGVAVLYLRQRIVRDRPAHNERPTDDLAAFPAESGIFRRVEQELDLTRVLQQLTPDERALYGMIHTDALDKSVICARLGLTTNAFEQRKSRLLARLTKLLAATGAMNARNHA